MPDAGGRVFAAGDATDFPIKHGGLGAQQADTAAAGIARLAGADSASYMPTLRAMFLTGNGPLYLSARIAEGEGLDCEMSDKSPWSHLGWVDSEELGPYIAKLEANET